MNSGNVLFGKSSSAWVIPNSSLNESVFQVFDLLRSNDERVRWAALLYSR